MKKLGGKCPGPGCESEITAENCTEIGGREWCSQKCWQAMMDQAGRGDRVEAGIQLPKCAEDARGEEPGNDDKAGARIRTPVARVVTESSDPSPVVPITLRETIARIIEAEPHHRDAYDWDHCSEETRESYRKCADTIIALCSFGHLPMGTALMAQRIVGESVEGERQACITICEDIVRNNPEKDWGGETTRAVATGIAKLIDARGK